MQVGRQSKPKLLYILYTISISEIKMSFAENLKYIRKKRNITQEQLADILSVSRQAIS